MLSIHHKCLPQYRMMLFTSNLAIAVVTRALAITCLIYLSGARAASDLKTILIRSGTLTTSSILVHWNNTLATTGKHRVSYTPSGLTAEHTMYSSWQPSEKSSFRIQHLPSNTKFNICVTSQYPNALPSEVTECSEISTIPVLQTSSIVALTLTLGYIVGTALLGWCWWRCRIMSRDRVKSREEMALKSSYTNNRNIEEDETELCGHWKAPATQKDCSNNKPAADAVVGTVTRKAATPTGSHASAPNVDEIHAKLNPNSENIDIYSGTRV
ncbi:uncharacterized protein LOC141909468 [Tubulanus polymorphus]|uniref:uncharacterized protein LOC141909468 n=1 Tax=Tubulanus polymorphus TaxID=672921 RepID=UPI003DA1FDF0